MNNDDIDEKEFEDRYTKQSELSVFVSTLLLLIFLVLSFMLCKYTLADIKYADKPITYQMSATIESIERHGEEFSMTVDGIHDGKLEIHIIAIDRSEFMKYKQGEEINVKVVNNRCYIVE